jgi:hypothetical protein
MEQDPKEYIIQQQFQKIIDFLNKNFFSLCRDKVTAEIGCFEGHLTEHILLHNPSELILLEANNEALKIVQQKFPQCKSILGDMHLDFNKVGQVDIVFLLGVIYHSHAPLHILEEMVHYSNPQTIVIDNPGSGEFVIDEIPNIPGMRYITDGRKSCNLCSLINEEVIIKAMKNLGYSLIKRYKYPEGSRVAGNEIMHFDLI